MSRRLLACTAAVVTAVAVTVTVIPAATPASAGGWAMTSLDPMAVPVAGEEVTVGFTIRQHGVSPVNPDEQGDAPVEVSVRSASGTAAVFPARQEGPTGHYVATVTFPDAGEASWEVVQGWFGPHDLGTIAVAAPGASPAERPAAKDPAVAAGVPGASPAGAGASALAWPLAARVGVTLVALAAVAVAAAELWRGRRRAGRSTRVVPS